MNHLLVLNDQSHMLMTEKLFYSEIYESENSREHEQNASLKTENSVTASTVTPLLR